MKIFALILALMVLVQSAVPCADGVDTLKAKTELSAGQQTQDDHNDMCSPFCICTCCSGVSVYCMLATIDVVNADLQVEYNSIPSTSITGISLPIWQPPQLS